MSDVCVYCFVNTHTHTHSSCLAAEQASPSWPKKKNKTAGQDAEHREYRIKEQIEMDKLSAKHQFHNVTSQTATKTTLKPEAQKFMVRYGTSKDFGEDEKHKILLYFSLLILLIRCRGRQENAKAK